jgi:hypothetical protein
MQPAITPIDPAQWNNVMASANAVQRDLGQVPLREAHEPNYVEQVGHQIQEAGGDAGLWGHAVDIYGVDIYQPEFQRMCINRDFRGRLIHAAQILNNPDSFFELRLNLNDKDPAPTWLFNLKDQVIPALVKLEAV